MVMGSRCASLVATALAYGCSSSHQTHASSETRLIDPCPRDGKVFVDGSLFRLNLPASELEKVTFYAGANLLLERKLSSDEVAVRDHKVVTRNGVVFEQVALDCLTPGRLVDKEWNSAEGSYTIHVSFEHGSRGLAYSPRPDNGGQYHLVADDNAVSYEGATYNLACSPSEPSGCSLPYRLMIEEQALKAMEHRFRKLPGDSPD